MRRAIAAMAVALSVAACGGSGQTAQQKAAAEKQKIEACWDGTLRTWAKTSYTDWVEQLQQEADSDPTFDPTPPETAAGYREQVLSDAAYWVRGLDSPGGINDDERAEFAKVQQRCGKVRQP
jgi:hypothetical protein